MEILSGVYLIKMAMSNCYLIAEDDGLTLIDAGVPSSFRKITAFISSLSCPIRDLKKIFLTHADMDHVGAAMALKAESGARIYAGEIAAQALAEGHSSRQIKMGWLTPLFDWFEQRGEIMRIFDGTGTRNGHRD